MRSEDMKILVVDDTQFMVSVISYALKSQNYQVIAAYSGPEALEKVRSEKPNLILLDVVMPGMSGYDVCQALREDFRYNLIPIIMLTGQTEEEDKLRGLEMGADDYIVKPFVNRELLARVKNTLVRLERLRDCNPLTGLRGNNEIELEITRRLGEGAPFAVLYGDLNSFKPYNDIYGFAAGDQVICATADAFNDAVEACGTKSDFVGHIGGDDFVVVLESHTAIAVAQEAIRRFDANLPAFYSVEHLEQGYITAKDRDDNIRRFALLGLSIAIAYSDYDEISSTEHLAKVSAGLKKKAKTHEKSAYVTSDGCPYEPSASPKG